MHRYGCRPQDHPRIGRRDLLEVGGMTLLGTGLADLLRLESAGVETDRSARATAKSVDKRPLRTLFFNPKWLHFACVFWLHFACVFPSTP